MFSIVKRYLILELFSLLLSNYYFYFIISVLCARIATRKSCVCERIKTMYTKVIQPTCRGVPNVTSP